MNIWNMPSPNLNKFYTKSGSVGSVCLRLLQCVQASGGSAATGGGAGMRHTHTFLS